jgi:predicted nuclease of predicted toxin-antitoxin system
MTILVDMNLTPRWVMVLADEGIHSVRTGQAWDLPMHPITKSWNTPARTAG